MAQLFGGNSCMRATKMVGPFWLLVGCSMPCLEINDADESRDLLIIRDDLHNA